MCARKPGPSRPVARHLLEIGLLGRGGDHVAAGASRAQRSDQRARRSAGLTGALVPRYWIFSMSRYCQGISGVALTSAALAQPEHRGTARWRGRRCSSSRPARRGGVCSKASLPYLAMKNPPVIAMAQASRGRHDAAAATAAEQAQPDRPDAWHPGQRGRVCAGRRHSLGRPSRRLCRLPRPGSVGEEEAGGEHGRPRAARTGRSAARSRRRSSAAPSAHGTHSRTSSARSSPGVPAPQQPEHGQADDQPGEHDPGVQDELVPGRADQAARRRWRRRAAEVADRTEDRRQVTGPVAGGPRS